MLTGNLLWRVSSRTALNRFDKEGNSAMNALLDVINVEAMPDYSLFLEFENGEKRIFDMSPLMDKKPFAQLKGTQLFTRAFVDYGTVVWPGNIDIAPEMLYDRSRPA